MSQKEADYQAAMKQGKQFLTLGDTDVTKLQPAFDQFQAALKSKLNDTEATGNLQEVRGKIDKAFSLAFETGSRAASAGDKGEANGQLEKMKALKPGDSKVGELVAVIANMAVPRPPTAQHQPTNLAGVFGQPIPDLDFVWVGGIGTGGGAYVAVNELSWEQYQALGGSEKPLDSVPNLHRPADLDFDKAQALVDLLNGNPAYKKVKFRLPSLDEYEILSGVPDLAAISDLVTADTSAGENFKKPGDLKPREIIAGPTTNKLGLRNVIGNVREWTAKGVPFGNSYAWGKSLNHSVTLEQRTTGEQIGLRLICEPTN
jgi:hypothetical protein